MVGSNFVSCGGTNSAGGIEGDESQVNANQRRDCPLKAALQVVSSKEEGQASPAGCLSPYIALLLADVYSHAYNSCKLRIRLVLRQVVELEARPDDDFFIRTVGRSPVCLRAFVLRTVLREPDRVTSGRGKLYPAEIIAFIPGEQLKNLQHEVQYERGGRLLYGCSSTTVLEVVPFVYRYWYGYGGVQLLYGVCAGTMLLHLFSYVTPLSLRIVSYHCRCEGDYSHQPVAQIAISR